MERFLSDAALEDLGEFGGINVVPHLDELEEDEILEDEELSEEPDPELEGEEQIIE